MSYTSLEHYIDGNWVKPTGSKTQEVMNPAKNTPIGELGFASKGDLDKALAAARSGVTREPELQPLWWFLLTVQLDRKEVAPALATIDELTSRFGIAMDEEQMRAEPKYGFLLASPEWKQRQAAAAAE